MSSTAHAASFQLGPKGRAVLPVSARRAAGIPDGATFVAVADGPGRIILETHEAIRDRVWAAASGNSDTDAVADVRAMRDEDADISDANALVRSRPRDEGRLDEAGAALLALLSL